MSDTTADPQGFIQFAKELEKALAPVPDKGRGPDKQKRKARKTGTINLETGGTASMPSGDSYKPHLETRVAHDGKPAQAEYGVYAIECPSLKEALVALKGYLGGKWPNTLTQEEKNVITAATGEIFERREEGI